MFYVLFINTIFFLFTDHKGTMYCVIKKYFRIYFMCYIIKYR